MRTIQTFKKGQLFPRRLGLVLTSIKGAQHCLTFGVDVEWDGVTLKPSEPMWKKGVLLRVRYKASRRMRNGTRQNSSFYLCHGVEMFGSSDTTTGEYYAYIKKSVETMGRNP